MAWRKYDCDVKLGLGRCDENGDDDDDDDDDDAGA